MSESNNAVIEPVPGTAHAAETAFPKSKAAAVRAAFDSLGKDAATTDVVNHCFQRFQVTVSPNDVSMVRREKAASPKAKKKKPKKTNPSKDTPPPKPVCEITEDTANILLKITASVGLQAVRKFLDDTEAKAKMILR